MKSKIPAFTILELIVSMILSSVVIITALALNLYTIKVTNVIKQINLKLMERSTFYNLIENEVLIAKSITGDSDHWEITIQEDQVIHYYINNLNTVRCSNGICDTFHLALLEKHVEYLDEITLQNPLISHISFAIENDDQTLPFQLSKEYSASEVIQLTGSYSLSK